MGRKVQDLVGKSFNSLTVLAHLGKGLWQFKCVCGRVYISECTPITKGLVKSCGCQKAQLCGAAHKTHGYSSRNEYSAWKSMMRRCYTESYSQFSDYGGRGIKVCHRWHNPKNFVEDMGDSYFLGGTLERIDVNKGYSKNNCRWASRSEQTFNQRKRASSLAVYPGVTWSNIRSKWWARITKNGKTKSLGFFKDKTDAIKARRTAELEVYNFNRGA